MRTLLLAAAAACLAACSNAALPQSASAEPAARVAPASHEAVAVFAGGCFWCIEAELEAVPGVRAVVSGYTGGTTPDPTYKRMGDHAEAVEVIYDPAEVTYEQLLEVFWSNIDPTDEGGQFYDRGSQYRTAIYVLDEAQAAAARASLEANARRLSQPIATAVLPAGAFYPAEDYHQDYYLKEPERYQAYKKGSRREETLRDVWQTQ
ncbi:MAG: peptide-methionine (S)-S-oxide reductase [Alphaproteobacteria bacterium HGW-Alphaproteobacteria-18]|nr:MAG: peptide-methionine (S)-S-oxide reductase [Alphaproteobacteria bacterium HGW-Alphaproteobacteria-18]